eukprot:4414600-Prymnesium_polylepis.1
MQYSESAFVSAVMRHAAEAAASAAMQGGQKGGGGGKGMKSGKFQGVIDHFLVSLRDLIGTLQAGAPTRTLGFGSPAPLHTDPDPCTLE